MSLHNKLYSKQKSNKKVPNVKWHIRNSNVTERKIWTDSIAELYERGAYKYSFDL